VTESVPFAGPLLAAVRAYAPSTEIAKIERAARVATEYHAGQYRRSGDPYITHPVAVATIIAELAAHTEVVCAALLHDLIDDTNYTADQMRGEFGDAITDLVLQVGALDQETANCAERDILLVKIADRLHNMRTLSFLRPERRVLKARQTMDVIVPIARELGLHSIGRELAELSGRYLQTTVALGRPARASSRMLELATLLLPATSRARWREEWQAEILHLPSTPARLRFTFQTLIGVPRLASTLNQRSGIPFWIKIVTQLANILGLTSALVVFTAPGTVAVWVAGGVALTALALIHGPGSV
jgi:GTP pyrophosphokinase